MELTRKLIRWAFVGLWVVLTLVFLVLWLVCYRGEYTEAAVLSIITAAMAARGIVLEAERKLS